MAEQDPAVILARLSEPFAANEVKFKPQAVKGNRAMAIAFIDARLVAERLDEVVGMNNWQDCYTPLPDGSVACRLRVRVSGEWIEKEDVGSQSEQPDGGDRMKAAYSDALKRAGVKFGIGRYLYRLPLSWVDYDPQGRKFTNPPRLPDWAMPKGGRSATPKPAEPAKATDADRHAKGVAAVKETIAQLARARGTKADFEEAGIARSVNKAKETIEALTIEELQKAFRIAKSVIESTGKAA